MPKSGKHYITCPLCEAECGLEITVGDRQIESVRGDQQNAFSRGFMCPKALAIKDIHNDPDRLQYPVRRTGSGWQQIGWKQAFDEIQKRIKDIRHQYGNEALAFFV